jgi:hypothetical protein
MFRIAVIGLTFVFGLAAAVVAGVRYGSASAVASGRELHPHRKLLAAIAKAEGSEKPPAVVWLGDSTLMGQSYPLLVGRTRFGPSKPSLVLAAPGLDCWAHYQLLGRVMSLHPRVVVMIANMRVLRAESSSRTFNDFAQAIAADELPRTLALPYSFRGITAPRLLLARLLDTGWGEETFLMAEGIRHDFQTAEAWRSLGPEVPPRGKRERALRFIRGNRQVAAAYDAPIGPRTPLVRFCRAAVRVARDRGAEVLVVVSPMPTAFLVRQGRYDAARVAARVAMLRGEFEAEGATVLDLHDALSTGDFRDNAGHFSVAGHARMAGLVGPEVAARWLATTAR